MLCLGHTATGSGINHEPMERPYRLEKLDAEGIPAVLAGVSSPLQWEQKRAAILAAWIDYMGGLPERPPLEWQVVKEEMFDDHLRQTVVYNTVYGDQVTAYLLLPLKALDAEGRAVEGKRFAAILALHTSNEFGKAMIATKEGRKNRTYGLELVRRGYIVLAPDIITAGDRIYPGYRHFDTTAFYLKHPEWTSVGKNLTDHLQAMDLLATHPLVDPQRIGAIGHSLGGYNAYFIASVDKRLAALVSSCGVCPFSGSPEHIKGHWAKRRYTHFPQYTEDLEKGQVPFEFNEIMALAAPVPQFYYATQEDAIFPHWEAVAQCFLDLQKLYEFLGIRQNLVTLMGDGGHDFPPAIRQMAYAFLDSYLQVETPSPADAVQPPSTLSGQP